MAEAALAKDPRDSRVRSALLTLAIALVAWSIATMDAFAQLRGHGGPVRALAISADGQSAVSGSFDSTAIRWSLMAFSVLAFPCAWMFWSAGRTMREDLVS